MQAQCSTHWAIPLSHNALPTELSHYPIVLYPLSYPTIPYSALPIELSDYPIMLYPLSYPTIPYSALPIELSHYPIVLFYWAIH